MKKRNLLMILIITVILFIPLNVNAESYCSNENYACAYCEYRIDNDNTLKYLIKGNGNTIPNPSILDEFENEIVMDIKDNLLYKDFATNIGGVESLACPNQIYIYSGLGNKYVYKEENSQKESGTSFKKEKYSLTNSEVNNKGLFQNSSDSNSAQALYECSFKVYNNNNLEIDTAKVYSDGNEIKGISFTKSYLSIASSDYSKYTNFAKEITNNKCPNAKINCTDKGNSKYSCELLSNSDDSSKDGDISYDLNYTDTDYCESLKGVWVIAGYAIFLLKVLVPILLIVMSMIDLTKAIAANKDTKPLEIIKNKIIAAVLVFLVLQIFTMALNVVGEGKEWQSCAKCTVKPFDSDCSLLQVKQEHDGR